MKTLLNTTLIIALSLATIFGGLGGAVTAPYFQADAYNGTFPNQSIGSSPGGQRVYIDAWAL